MFVVAWLWRTPVGAAPVVKTRQKPRQLGQGHFINAPFELNHHIERYPEIVPTPSVKLGVAGGTLVDIPVRLNQLE